MLVRVMYLSCNSVEVCSGDMHFPSTNSHPGIRDAFGMSACNDTKLEKGQIVGKKH